MQGGFFIMLMHIPLIPLPKILKYFIDYCTKKNMAKSKIYNIVFYNFLALKLVLFFLLNWVYNYKKK